MKMTTVALATLTGSLVVAAGAGITPPRNVAAAPPTPAMSAVCPSDTPGGDFACVLTGEEPHAALRGVEGVGAPSTDETADSRECGDAPERQITNPYGSFIQYSIVYGQSGSPVNGSWAKCIDLYSRVFLQTESHQWALSLYTSLKDAIDIHGTVQILEFHGILPASVTDADGYSQHNVTTFTSSGWLRGTPRGTYAMKMASTTITDYDKAFDITLDANRSTFRFLCNGTNQCNYPDGHEAPIF
jgi:hypothetical protein